MGKPEQRPLITAVRGDEGKVDFDLVPPEEKPEIKPPSSKRKPRRVLDGKMAAGGEHRVLSDDNEEE